MKRFITLLFLVLFIGSSIPAAAQSIDAAAWREDLQFLWDKIQHHPDPFRTTPKDTLTQMVTDLDANIPTMTDEQIIVGILNIVAALRDGHSSMWFQQDAYPFQYYPLHFYPFSDGVYIIEASPEYTDLVGARLLQINGIETADVTEKLIPLEPRDNDSSGLVTLPMMLSLADVLMGVGVIDDPAQPNYLLERTDGEQITLNPKLISLAQYHNIIPVHWRLPQQTSPLSLIRVDEPFWWTTLNDDTVIYLQYNQVITRSDDLTISKLRQALETELADKPITRFILDLRYNGGGDINTAAPLRSFFAKQPLFQQPDSLIVLIGRNTFSAATVFSLWLEKDVNPVFMGESTGGQPHMFENARQFDLPNSKLHFQIATQARRDVAASDTRQTVSPTVDMVLSSTDYFAGNDPVLDAALNFNAETD